MKNFLQFCGYVLMQSTDVEKLKGKKIASKWYVQYFSVHMYYIVFFAQNAQATYLLLSYLYLHG